MAVFQQKIGWPVALSICLLHLFWKRTSEEFENNILQAGCSFSHNAKVMKELQALASAMEDHLASFFLDPPTNSRQKGVLPPLCQLSRAVPNQQHKNWNQYTIIITSKCFVSTPVVVVTATEAVRLYAIMWGGSKRLRLDRSIDRQLTAFHRKCIQFHSRRYARISNADFCPQTHNITAVINYRAWQDAITLLQPATLFKLEQTFNSIMID